MSRNRSFHVAASSPYTSLLKVSQKNALLGLVDVFSGYFFGRPTVYQRERSRENEGRQREMTCDKDYRQLAPLS